jgi:hypothetical protein
MLGWLCRRLPASVEIFLISGSNEERQQYAGDIIVNQDIRIILCSIQYVQHASDTIDYIGKQDFWTYIQWRNPGYSDTETQYWDHLGIANRLLSMEATLSIRSGKRDPISRVKEIREFIFGWASARGLILPD